MATLRFYKCGCEPDFDNFCKEADKRVWEERDALTEWALAAEELSKHDEATLDIKARKARRWLVEHLKAQDAAGFYTDVEEMELEPPEDFGGDEDPRAMGLGQ